MLAEPAGRDVHEESQPPLRMQIMLGDVVQEESQQPPQRRACCERGVHGDVYLFVFCHVSTAELWQRATPNNNFRLSRQLLFIQLLPLCSQCQDMNTHTSFQNDRVAMQRICIEQTSWCTDSLRLHVARLKKTNHPKHLNNCSIRPPRAYTTETPQGWLEKTMQSRDDRDQSHVTVVSNKKELIKATATCKPPWTHHLHIHVLCSLVYMH